MAQAIWEAFITYIFAPFFLGLTETAIFFSQFGIAGLVAILVLPIAVAWVAFICIE